MNVVTDYKTDISDRNLASDEWRERVERAINVEVMTAGNEEFLVQVTDEWFVWVTKTSKSSQKTYKWIELRAKVNLSTFLRVSN